MGVSLLSLIERSYKFWIITLVIALLSCPISRIMCLLFFMYEVGFMLLQLRHLFAIYDVISKENECKSNALVITEHV